MKRFLFVLLIFCSILNLAFGQTELELQLQSRLENLQPQDQLQINRVTLTHSDEINRFYASSAFEPVWVKEGKIKSNAQALVAALDDLKYDGLNPKNYHQDIILSYTQKGNDLSIGQLADLELLLSDAFFQASKDLHEGRVDHQNFKGDWEINSKIPRYNYSELLSQAKNGSDINSIFKKLYPGFQIYGSSREVIKNLYGLAEKNTQEWKDLQLKGAIRVGEENKIVPELRTRLVFWGFLQESTVSEDAVYDSTIMRAVKAFQKRNGMNDDGIIGKLTLNALNQSPTDLIAKASVNMERLRWLPDTVKTGPLVLVNIANYQLDYLNDLDTLLSERVIVGKRYHESPIFTAQMSYIVFSPYWNLPYSITKNEILPKARRDASYLASKNIEIVDNSGKVISPSAVDFNAKSFPYRLRQKPGESNSLGLVKFMFPNNHSVYIHDTPARTLFEKEERAMSHGCIRLENPADFAALLLRDKPEWTTSKIYDAMHQSSEKTVHLGEKIPVVLLYLTFWTDGVGNPHFRPDIYERDADLLAELQKSN